MHMGEGLILLDWRALSENNLKNSKDLVYKYSILRRKVAKQPAKFKPTPSK